MTAISLPIYDRPSLAPVREAAELARKDSIDRIEHAAASIDDRIERSYAVASSQFDLRNAFDVGHAIKSAIASLIVLAVLIIPAAPIAFRPPTAPDTLQDWVLMIVFVAWASVMLVSLVGGAVFFATPVWQVLSRGFSYTFLQGQMHVARQVRAIGSEAIYVHGKSSAAIEVIRYDAIGSIFLKSGKGDTTSVVIDGRDGKTISSTDGWFKGDAERFVETVAKRIPKVADMIVKD